MEGRRGENKGKTPRPERRLIASPSMARPYVYHRCSYRYNSDLAVTALCTAVAAWYTQAAADADSEISQLRTFPCHNPPRVADNEFSGEGFRARAGSLTLLYLASSVKRDLLRRLLAESITGVELVEPSELPDEDDPVDTSVVFSDTYLIEPVNPNDDPNDPDTMFKPTPAGREVPFVGEALKDWLRRCPSGPLELGPGAGPVLWPLLSAWSATVLHAFATGPRTAAEVCDQIHALDLERVETRIDLLEDAGLIEAQPCAPDEEEPFAATDWLRLAVAPLSAAARMELRHPPGDTAPIAAGDVEAAFHMTMPLLRLPAELAGTCSMAVELDDEVGEDRAGVTVQVEDGQVVSCETGFDEGADAWAVASAADWLETVIEGDAERVSSGGDLHLAGALLSELHRTLFGLPVS